MDFIPLHLYSGYSFLKSGILFKDLSKDLVKKGYKQVGLTDYNVMYGYPLFNKTLLNNNIKPIFGLDLHVNENLFTLIVKNENGYKNLCYISTYLEKRAGICSDFNEIKDYLGDLICVISSKSSKIFNSVNEHIFLDYLNKLNSLFSDFYIGLEIYSNNDQIKANLINEFSSLYNIKLIAFPFIKYLNKGDELRLKILEAISKDTAIETIDDDISNDYYLRTKEEINTLYDFKYLKELNSLVSKINFNFNVKRGELLNFTISSIQLKRKINYSLNFFNFIFKPILFCFVTYIIIKYIFSSIFIVNNSIIKICIFIAIYLCFTLKELKKSL